MVEGYVIDIESNGFFFASDKIWTICVKDINNPDKKMTLNPFKDDQSYNKLKEWHSSYINPIVAGHFILGFDMFVLFKLLGVSFTVGKDSLFGNPCIFVDTLYLSQYINPDIDGHSLEAWGERLGINKIDYFEVAKEKGIIQKDSKKGDEFSVHSEYMDVYCERDVDVNIKLLHKLLSDFCRIYGITNFSIPDHYKCGQKNFFLMSCQEYTGWKFDVKYGLDLAERIKKMMDEIEQNVLPKLPPRKLKKGEQKEYTLPAKPFKQDGSFSSHMLNFIEKHKGSVVSQEDKIVNFYGKDYEISSRVQLEITVPMELKDGDDLKEWFISQGWVPTLYNYKRGADGKPVRDEKTKELIKTTPKMQEQGKLCPNLEKLDGEIPKQIVKFLSLRNRLSVLTSWCEDQRITMDGRLSPSRTGITPTHRQKHSKVVNVPKASEKVLLGKEFRSLFVCEEGMLIAAGDAAALEGRVMAHYTYKFDNGVTANELLNGDPHSKNAFAFFSDELSSFGFTKDQFDKDDPKFKPFRDKSKNGFYALKEQRM